MTQDTFPPGWDDERVQRVLAHYEGQTESRTVAEDEGMTQDPTQTVMEVPRDPVPTIRALIAEHGA